MKNFLIKIKPEYLIVISLAIVYIWFGALKVLGISPVEQLVSELSNLVGADKFALLGLVEVILGIGILIPRLRFIFAILIILHLIGVSIFSMFFPGLMFSPETILTLEGQFVVKNLTMIAAAYYLVWKNLSKKLD